jgi:tRNA nucleotidyltransferase/poly(A) polymerase
MGMDINFFKKHPQWPLVEEIVRVLVAEGFQAVLAGGCVRDALLGKEPHDLDVATNAPPEKVESLFPKVIPVGKNFGVCRVVSVNEETGESSQIEVATFREESDYKDGRRPDTVIYSTIEKDALRRDFTINAMFFDPQTGHVLDLVDGKKDLEQKLIKTVGDPEQRFGEDFLRILRAARFSAQLNFHIEEKTAAAMKKKAGGLQRISQERIQDECHKAFKSMKPLLFFEEVRKAGILPLIFFKEMGDSWDENLWTPLKKFFAAPAEPPLAWAAISLAFLRWGKKPLDPSNRARLRNFLKEKKLSNDLISQVETIMDAEVFLQSGKIEDFIALAKKGSTDLVLKFWSRDEASRSEKNPRVPKLKEFAEKYLKSGKLPEPRVRGEDLMQMGIPEGPDVKRWLDKVYLYQLDNQDKNRKQILEDLSEDIAKNEKPVLSKKERRKLNQY